MSKRITIKEIAEKANVSIGTVDRVLHNRNDVAFETRQRVLKIIKEKNYNVNIHARNLVLNKEFKIIALLPKCEPLEYWKQPMEGISRASDEYKSLGMFVDIRYYDNNRKSYNQHADQIIASSPDGIIIAPTMQDAARNLMEMADKLGIPMVLIDANVPNQKKLTFIGQDSHQSGYLAGKLINTINYKKLPIICLSLITDTNNNFNNQRRIEGLKSYFSDHAHSKDYFINLKLKSNDPVLQDHVFDILDKNQEGGSIFVPNSRVYLIARAIEKFNAHNKWNLIGYDLIQDNIFYLKKGIIDFLIHQNAARQGYAAVQCLYKKLILKHEIETKYLMPLEIIMKENVDFVNKENWV